MADAPELESLFDPIRQAMADMEARASRFGRIEATIRVNAMRHGATDAQIEDFIAGRADFVAWMCEIVERHQDDLATAAAREEGVRLGLLAGADRLAIQRTVPRDDSPRDAWERGNDSGVGACQTLIRAIAADPEQVAAIAKGGE